MAPLHTENRLIDLSHTVEHGLVTYPGLPAPSICDYLSREASRDRYAPGVEFQIGKIEMVANTGTYVDSPFHRYPNGRDLSELLLTSLADVEAVVIRARGRAERAIDEEALATLGVDLNGKAVLFDTGWSRYFGTEAYGHEHPFLTEGAARYLVQANVAIVGIDSLNIDDIADPRRPVHSTVLGANIPIVEHMTGLDRMPDRGARFFAVPVKVRGFGSFPVRAFAIRP
jgi:arylformamidase